MDGTAESDVMRRLTGCIGAIAMVLALVTAPLYHFHDRDHHGKSVSLVHAHLPEAEDSDHHSDNSIEDRHSHRSARYVDFFTFSAPPTAIDLVVELTTSSLVTVLDVVECVTIDTEPQSHSPPCTRQSVPRSPPAI